MITKPLRERATGNSDFAGDGSAWTLRLAVLVAIVGLLIINRGFVIPLAMAGLFAATLAPLSRKLERRIPRKSARSALMTLGFTVTFLVPLCIVAFLAADAGLRRVKTMPEDWTGQIKIDYWLDKLDGLLPFERSDILRVLEQGATAIGKAILAMLQNLVADLPKLTVDNIVIIFGVYVFLVESENVVRWLKRVSPLSGTKTEKLFATVCSLSASTVLASVVSGLTQSLIIGAVCVVMGVPGTLLITMTAFVLSFIPVMGTAPVSLWLVGSSIMANDWTSAITFMVTAGVVGVSDNFVRPYVLSGSSSLHPLVGFVAAFGALETMGFYGLFLGPVVAGAVFMLVGLVMGEDAA